ncbi:MAG: DUF4293 domain-containing protein [Paludibacteraceae bacterium]
MLQRIQTVYLFLVIVLITLSAVLPIAFYSNLTVGNQFNYTILRFLSPSDDAIKGFSSIPLAVPAAICVILALFEIFTYKKRNIQINLGIFNIIFNAIYLGVLIYYFNFVLTNGYSSDIKVLYKYPLIFPIVALIFKMCWQSEALKKMMIWSDF